MVAQVIKDTVAVQFLHCLLARQSFFILVLSDAECLEIGHVLLLFIHESSSVKHLAPVASTQIYDFFPIPFPDHGNQHEHLPPGRRGMGR